MRALKGSLWAALAALLFACSTEEEPFDSHTAITTASTNVSAAKGSAFVSVTCKGDWTVELNFGGVEPWATLSLESGSGNRGDLLLSYSANEGEASREVTLSLVPKNGLTASLTLIQAAPGGGTNPGGGGEIPEAGYGYDVAPMDWLELPATTAGDGRELLVHNMKGTRYVSESTDGTRNWSCYYDYRGYTSVWVAYPHNNSLKGSGDRSDAWGYDPLLPQDLQQWITYRVNGGRYYSDYQYDRGHQLPSADRYGTLANMSTFYPTNMTPQTGDFNQHIWADLEDDVRACMTVADTLYVVTGCIIDNSTIFVTDRNETELRHQVPVPTAYFKALLYYGPSSYAVADRYMAAGFFMPHDAGIGYDDYWKYRKSIDELEGLTGFDFFPNLVTKIGKEKAEKIEATAPSDFWHKKN